MEMQEQVIDVTEEPIVEAPASDTIEQPAESAPVEQDDAAFEAGFNAANGIEAEASAEPEPTPEPEPQAKALIAGMTEEQVKELLQKAAEVDKLREAQSKVFGTLGAMRQAIEALRQQPQPTPAAVQMTKDKLKRLSEMFPEMAEMLAEDLSGVLTAPVAAIDPSQFEQAVQAKLDEQLSAQQRKFEAKVLSAMHPDWRQIVPSPEFAQWRSTLDPEVAAALDDSWDAEFIGAKLSEFKTWKNQQAKSQQLKVKRLEAAVTPKGSPKPPAMTDDDAFIAGFKSARGL